MRQHSAGIQMHHQAEARSLLNTREVCKQRPAKMQTGEDAGKTARAVQMWHTPGFTRTYRAETRMSTKCGIEKARRQDSD